MLIRHIRYTSLFFTSSAKYDFFTFIVKHCLRGNCNVEWEFVLSTQFSLQRISYSKTKLILEALCFVDPHQCLDLCGCKGDQVKKHTFLKTLQKQMCFHIKHPRLSNVYTFAYNAFTAHLINLYDVMGFYCGYSVALLL